MDSLLPPTMTVMKGLTYQSANLSVCMNGMYKAVFFVVDGVWESIVAINKFNELCDIWWGWR